MIENPTRIWGWAACALGLVGCGSRASAWDAPFTPSAGVTVSSSYGLTGSVAVVDAPLGRVLMLRSPSALSIDSVAFGLGHDLATAQVSSDKKTLFALSRGVQPQRSASDELPQLMLIDGSTAPSVLKSYVLTEPMDNLALDPQNEWAVVYGGSGTVVNPNELVLVDLSQDGDVAQTFKTLRSTGGKPKRLTFTPKLAVAGADPRRFLVVERDSDIVLIDLSNPVANVVTVPLPVTENGQTGTSAQIVYDAASATLAVRVAGSSSVYALPLGAPAQPDEAFSVAPNLIDVGGIPAAIDFMHTADGLRLVALVGTNAVLVDPVMTNLKTKPLSAAFTGIRRITAALDATASATADDVALLYSQNSTTIAFLTLDASTSNGSVDSYDIGVSVKDVIDVPGDTFADRKILETPAHQFYMLDLTKRQSAPMETSTGLTLQVAPDGDRVWAYEPGGTGFASVDFSTLHPISLKAERAVSSVYEIEAADGGHSALALHAGNGQGLGATVVDAVHPSTATARFYSGLEFGGVK